MEKMDFDNPLPSTSFASPPPSKNVSLSQAFVWAVNKASKDEINFNAVKQCMHETFGVQDLKNELLSLKLVTRSKKEYDIRSADTVVKKSTKRKLDTIPEPFAEAKDLGNKLFSGLNAVPIQVCEPFSEPPAKKSRKQKNTKTPSVTSATGQEKAELKLDPMPISFPEANNLNGECLSTAKVPVKEPEPCPLSNVASPKRSDKPKRSSQKSVHREVLSPRSVAKIPVDVSASSLEPNLPVNVAEPLSGPKIPSLKKPSKIKSIEANKSPVPKKKYRKLTDEAGFPDMKNTGDGIFSGPITPIRVSELISEAKSSNFQKPQLQKSDKAKKVSMANKIKPKRKRQSKNTETQA